MTEHKQQTVSVVLQALQLITLLIGVASVFLMVGRKDAQITSNSGEIGELRDIAMDLVRTSVEATSTNRNQDRQLDELRSRLMTLESQR
jgi:hypothetical protein|tara:strand:- start:3371 stop:3637 length:267 start_codon:yes stop_codon:yes gene_type:complete